METKLSKLKAAARKGDRQEALRIAARFPQLGDHDAEIKRAHEAFANDRFYAQIGRNRDDLIAAGVAALKARYGLNDQGDETMTKTFSNKSNAVRAAMKAGLDPVELTFIEAAGRWGWEVKQTNALLVVAAPAPDLGDDVIPDFLRKGSIMKTVEAVAPVETAPVTTAEPAPAKRQRSPGVKYEALFAQAEQGTLPPAPDLSAPTHKAFQKRGAKIIEMAEAGDIDGLRADTMEPKSSSRALICRYRDLAIVALAAKARKAAA